MAMMQGSNKAKKEGKPMGGPPVEMMSQIDSAFQVYHQMHAHI